LGGGGKKKVHAFGLGTAHCGKGCRQVCKKKNLEKKKNKTG